ncbi:MAG: single-stranded DNA-binding protein [Alphaproteobacteria bacterium]|nr:single-stranded DNA-binding protein [Alphaproteobacteria bacterium]
MNCINKAVLLGNLGRDPEIRTTTDGKPIAQFTLATSETWSGGPDQERQTRTEWHRVVIFNEHFVSLAERFLKKGQRVYIEGQIRTRKWTDQNGQENNMREIVLSRFRGELVILGDRNGTPESTEEPSSHAPASSKPNEALEELNDDIPF